MFIRGSQQNAQYLLNLSERMKSRIWTADGPWAYPRMDGRFLVRPLSGISGQRVFPSVGQSHMLDASGGSLDYLVNEFFNEFPPLPPLPDPGDISFYQDEILFGGGPLPQDFVVPVTDIFLDRQGIMGTFTPVVCQAVFPGVTSLVVPTKEACT